MQYCANPFYYQRRVTREVNVGPVGVGGDNPIRVQTMLVSDTMNTAACLEEALPIIDAGCEILRLTAPSINAARNLEHFANALRTRGLETPIVADIHFVPAAAMEAANWCEKVRINPGNYADRKKFAVREYTDDQYADELKRLEEAFTPLVLKCKELGRAMRIGTNHGSLSDRIMNRYGDTPLGMVESALEFVRICRTQDYHQVILSMKASNPKVMIEAYRLLVARLDEEGLDWNYPLHLGVTEAGDGEDGRIKSAIGIGALLEDGIGDTVRVSLTEDSVHEIPVCCELVARYNALFNADQTGRRPAPPRLTVTEQRDPFSYTRRATPETVIGGLRAGHDHPPRLELALPLDIDLAAVRRVTTDEEDTFAEILQFTVTGPADVERVAALKQQFRAENIFTPIALRLEQGAVVDRAMRAVAEKINVPYGGTEDVSHLLGGTEPVTIQFDVGGGSPAGFADACAALASQAGHFRGNQVLLAVGRVQGLDVIAAHRILAATFDRDSTPRPILIRDRVSPVREHHATINALLAASTDIGSLLCDGIGDLVEITGEDDHLVAVKLAYNILQAAGARTFKTDYVACPSCGRTLFDLQTVTARIKSRTSHLKGVKIAVMGCIVNGPGEMADADFGYVGTAPGKISLWVGKQQVKQHIPETEAVDELVELIREHGKWTEPA